MEKTGIVSENSMLSALAGLLFFGPLVSPSTRKKTDQLSPYESTFILSYCSLGIVNLGLAILGISGMVISYFFPNIITPWITTLCLWAVAIICCTGILGCLNQVILLDLDEQQVISNKGSVLKSFIPLYNVYLWYHLRKYDTPYRWLKESLLRWTLFIWGTVLLGSKMGIVLLVIILVRLLLLILNIDIISNSAKSKINQLFVKYPSELFAYPSGWLKAKRKKADIREMIDEKKLFYRTSDDNKMKVILQHSILLILLAILVYLRGFSEDNIVFWIALGLGILTLIIEYLEEKELFQLPLIGDLLSIKK
ncbi:MAG: hypothetical protein PHU61_01660 [Candidatus Absconditabacteria bacterium]|nr:hypothetical protein [Candidatus Absconditabacteria bacterium]MDD3867993.1 hypothetical protein [Candidatus Absconditabacteria bacterium]MDD4714240.1 hypothetical protein [Candidatus Absconditabacteria bacterium]